MSGSRDAATLTPSSSDGTGDGAVRAARPRIAYLSFSSGEYDGRTARMAGSALAAGYQVTVYARWHPGLPPVEERDGYRLIRVPFDWRLAVPGLRGRARRRAAIEMAQAARDHHARTELGGLGAEAADFGEAGETGDAEATDPAPGGRAGPTDDIAPAAATQVSTVRRVARMVLAPFRRWRRLVLMFPLRPMGWARALDEVAAPADIWHGMWAGSLPALDRMRRRHGGRTIYDSRDVYMQSRDFARMGWPGRAILAGLERRWARSADRVLTVNDPYADLLVGQLGVPRPPVVMNCPGRWDPPSPRPDLIRQALGLAPDTAVVLYQGQLTSERGIEQCMAAILDVPGAVLALLGFGSWADRLTQEASQPPYQGRVAVLPAVPPDALLDWTASADVMVMAIQPTTVNHRFTTPQKLFEAIAAGVPVVASDLPGMADIVGPTGIGVLCDPTDPAAIASAIRRIVSEPTDVREERHRHILDVAHTTYNWDAQLETLFGLYRELGPAPQAGPIAEPAAATAGTG